MIYGREDNKPKQERENFYEQLKNVIRTLPQNIPLLILGDFIARIGNGVIPEIKQRFNEQVINDNAELMIDLSFSDYLGINNTFFDHKSSCTLTFRNIIGQQSTICYIISNLHIQKSQIIDIKSLNSANVVSEHSLLLGKIKIKYRVKEKKNHQNLLIKSKWN